MAKESDGRNRKVDQRTFWQSIGETTSSNIVDHGDRILVTEACASVDHHLSTAFHLTNNVNMTKEVRVNHKSTNLWVSTLDAIKVQIGIALSGCVARSGTTSKANQHGRATKNNDMSAFTNKALFLQRVARANTANTTSQHDGLMVPAPCGSFSLGILARGFGREEGAEASGKTRATKFVVEASTADGSLEHDIETASIVGWAANVNLPWRFVVRDQEIRNPEASKTTFGHGTTANSGFITDFTTRAGGSTREGPIPDTVRQALK